MSNGVSRLGIQDNAVTMIVKMSDGNPGAANSLAEILQSKDNSVSFGGVHAILYLDTLGIYGSHIYVLHNDVCGRDVKKTLALITACQLGILSELRLSMACIRRPGNEKTIENIDEIVKQVQQHLAGG